MWIPLVDTHKDNGCLWVIPGSHKGAVAHHDLHESGKYLVIPHDHLKEGPWVCCEVPKGGVLLLTNKVMHASFKNTTQGVRWSMDLRYQSAALPTNAPITRLPDEITENIQAGVPAACYPPEADFLVRSKKRPDEVIRTPEQFNALRKNHERQKLPTGLASMETHGSDRSGRMIPMDRGITIKDIATRLGVHHTTVSRALRNHPDVNSKTRESVIKMARKLDYQPSSIARNFRTSRSTVIGLIVPNIHHHFFSHIISMITDMAYHHGFTVMTCQSNDDMHHEEQIIQSLIRNRVAGVLASIAQNNCRSDHYQALKARGIPLVFFDRFCQDLDVPKVSADNESGSAMAVNHLVGRDRKKIAIITGSCMVNVFAERLKGFKTALKHHGISPNEAFIVETGTEIYDGYEAAKYLMQRENRPDAVITVHFHRDAAS